MSKPFVSAFDTLGWNSTGKGGTVKEMTDWLHSLADVFQPRRTFSAFSPYCGAWFQATEFDAKPYSVEPR